MNVIRLFADENGESHIEDVALDLTEADFAPPAAPLLVSRASDALRVLFGEVPTGWDGSWHPTPARQYFVMLSGQLEAEVSDGNVRRVEPGDVALLEDTWGKGHVTRVLGDTEARVMFVQLPD